MKLRDALIVAIRMLLSEQEADAAARLEVLYEVLGYESPGTVYSAVL